MKSVSTLLLFLWFCLPSVVLAQDEQTHLSEARQAFSEEKFSKTIELLQLHEETDHSYESLLLLGDAHQKKGDYPSAIKIYDEAEALNALDAELFINRASAKIWNKEYKDAFKDLKKATSLEENNYRIYYYFGVANYYEFKNRSALKALDKCIKLNPQYAPAYYLRAANLGELTQYKPAIEDYETAYSLDSSLTVSLFNIAVLKYLDKDYIGAQQDLSQLLDADLDIDAEIYYYRAECAFNLNDKQVACSDYYEAKKRGDELAGEIYEKYCLKGEQRKNLPERNTQSISL